jgi:hypothetical protein
MAEKVRLDAATHTYWLGDKKVPGYSEIIKEMGVAKENKFYTDAGREEGISLHLWLAFLVRGKVPSAPPDPRIAGRVEGIQKFIKDTGFKIVGGEEPMYNPFIRYACTPDLWGHMGGKSWTIDLKRGAKLKIHRLQTFAQQTALSANGFMSQKRGVLYLKDGDYRLEEHTENIKDGYAWRATVYAYHATREYIS